VIQAEVKPGTREDAILHAAGANTLNGLRRTNADKRRAVEMVLRLDGWANKPDREIARQCGVGHALVNRMRNDPSVSKRQMQSATREVEPGGKVFEMDTSNIGKKKAPASKPSQRKQKPGTRLGLSRMPQRSRSLGGGAAPRPVWVLGEDPGQTFDLRLSSAPSLSAALTRS
jgi:hypothetical protein